MRTSIAGSCRPLLKPVALARPCLAPKHRAFAQKRPETLHINTPTPFRSAVPSQHDVHRLPARCSAQAQDKSERAPELVGEDAAAFSLEQQSKTSWTIFFALLTSVLGALYVVWIQPGTGLAEGYLAAVKSLSSDNPDATILIILFIFAVFHSGGAALRPAAEKVQSARLLLLLLLHI